MIAEATARIKRLAASDKLMVVANLVTALVKRNVAAATRPSNITLEDNIAVLDRAYTLFYMRTSRNLLSLKCS